MKNYRTIDEVEEEYLLNHPEEIDDYINLLFEEYSQSEDLSALMSSLHIILRLNGITNTAQDSGLTKKGVSQVLWEKGNPQFSTVHAIMHAIGYRLIPQKLTEKGVPST